MITVVSTLVDLHDESSAKQNNFKNVERTAAPEKWLSVRTATPSLGVCFEFAPAASF